jgi:hypothetical protein
MSVIKWFKRLLGSKREGKPLPSKIAIAKTPHNAPKILSPALRSVPFEAAELLESICELQKRSAGWPEIWATLNPDGDSQVERLLVELRGPHMFVPHIALNILEEECRRLARVNAFSDRLAALTAALNSGNRITRQD